MRARRSTTLCVSSPIDRRRAIVGYETRHSAWKTQNGACSNRLASDQYPSNCAPPMAAITRFTPCVLKRAANPTAWTRRPKPSIDRSIPVSRRGVTIPRGDAMVISAQPASARTTAAEATPHTPQPSHTVAIAHP